MASKKKYEQAKVGVDITGIDDLLATMGAQTAEEEYMIELGQDRSLSRADKRAKKAAARADRAASLEARKAARIQRYAETVGTHFEDVSDTAAVPVHVQPIGATAFTTVVQPIRERTPEVSARGVFDTLRTFAVISIGVLATAALVAGMQQVSRRR